MHNDKVIKILSEKNDKKTKTLITLQFSKTFPGNGKFSKTFPGIPANSRGSENSRQIFQGIFPELDYLAIFSDFQHFRSHFQQFVMLFYNPSVSFSIFSTNREKKLRSHKYFVLKYFANFKKQFLWAKKM